jgi:uncharacterized repeat protein (TIGR02543 family)
MNVKRLSKRTLATLLSVLLLLSTIVVGAATTASATPTTTGNGTVTIYFKNTVGWNSVYMYIYDDAYWFDGYGAGSSHSGDYKCNEYSTEGYQMHEIDSTNHIYAVTYSGYYTNYIAFTETQQKNYGNFAENNKVSYRGDFDVSAPMFIPDTVSNETVNTCTYYNNGTWSVADIPNPDAGDLSDVLHGSKVMFYYGKVGSAGTVFVNDGINDLVSHYTEKSYPITQSDTVYYSYACLPGGTKYYISDSTAPSGKQMRDTVSAGNMYRYKSSASNATSASKNIIGAWSSTSNATVTQGTVDSGLSCTLTNSLSVVGKTVSLMYYYTTDSSIKSTSTFTKVDIADVSALSVGKYYIYPVSYDGNIWVIGSRRILTVEAAPVPTQLTYAQTAIAGEGGTATASDGTNKAASIAAEPNANVTFTATPNPNYTFDGWYDNAQYTGEPVSTLDPYKINSVSSANTLYAKFSAVEAATEEDNDATAPPEETAPENRNNKRRDVKSVSLSEQAVKYYTEEVKDVDSYKTDDSGNSGVYSTFEILKSRENNKDQDSFDSIYADTTQSGDARYSKVSGDDDKYKYVIKNSLFGALYDIMSSTQTHSVSYPAYGKNSLAHYWLTTDSSKGNWKDNRGVYTMFYSDEDCYNHKDMQREHIWPKSKASYLMKTGLGGSDLHHLRPAYGKVNNIKSNWGFASIKTENNGAFTYNSGWTNKRTVEYPKGTPSLWRADDKNGETFIDVKDDVRGDVARILLYIYTRWREPNLYSDIFDSDGNPDTSKLPELDTDDKKDTGERIIYDKATLLDWMKNDPVSEWEMKRNDLTQDIQGNRNVFIDYPELAWLIFDENVPADMDTPSRPQGQNRTEFNKISESSVTYNDPVTIDISTTGNGIAEITAYDLTTNKAVKNGDKVERGDLITYTVVPDKSTITYVREYTTDSGQSHYKQLYDLNQDTEYTFTKQAGYYDGKVKTGTDSAQEILKLTINSKVCELFYKINSKTATGGSGGSGSGMVTVINKSTKKIIENGDTVPNGTEVTFTFTPDYGSKYAGLTYVNTQTAENISGTDSYKYTTTLDCSGGSVRKKTFTVYFAQTFNNTAGSDDAKKHINNKGMRPDENDNWKDETDFTSNFEICGVQIKKFSEGNENKALRFVSVVDKNILDKAKSYGYVIGKSDSSDYQTLNRFAYSLVKGNDARGVTMECTGSDNTVFGDYGKHDTTTNYKYITAAVEDIPDSDVNTTIIARPYVELKPEYVADGAPSVIYGQYVDFSTGDNYCSISTSYHHIYEMANTNKEEE